MTIEFLPLYVEHKRVVTRGQLAVQRIARFPRADNHSPRCWICLQETNDFRNLVNFRDFVLPVCRIDLCAGEAAPVTAVGCFKVSIRVCPCIPDLRLLPQTSNVILTREIPEHLVEKRLRLHALRRQQRIPFAQIDRVVLGKAR